jgi:hypothetical protein
MHFSFFDLIQHVAKTRRFSAGTILGSGTVSNADRTRGVSCLAERRMIEIIEAGGAKTPFMAVGDRIEIEAFDPAGTSPSAIDQRSSPHEARPPQLLALVGAIACASGLGGPRNAIAVDTAHAQHARYRAEPDGPGPALESPRTTAVHAFAQSMPILEYLEERFPSRRSCRAIVPARPARRLRDRQLGSSRSRTYRRRRSLRWATTPVGQAGSRPGSPRSRAAAERPVLRRRRADFADSSCAQARERRVRRRHRRVAASSRSEPPAPRRSPREPDQQPDAVSE